MIQLSGRFLKYNIIDKNGVQFPKSATIKIPSKVFVIILIKMGYGGETWQYWVILVLMTVYGGAFACEKDKEELE